MWNLFNWSTRIDNICLKYFGSILLVRLVGKYCGRMALQGEAKFSTHLEALQDRSPSLEMCDLLAGIYLQGSQMYLGDR